jgi:hypothetical protein
MSQGQTWLPRQEMLFARARKPWPQAGQFPNSTSDLSLIG